VFDWELGFNMLIWLTRFFFLIIFFQFHPLIFCWLRIILHNLFCLLSIMLFRHYDSEIMLICILFLIEFFF
jgi:hypothetical protein